MYIDLSSSNTSLRATMFSWSISRFSWRERQTVNSVRLYEDHRNSYRNFPYSALAYPCVGDHVAFLVWLEFLDCMYPSVAL